MNKHLAGLRSLFKGFEQRRPASAPPCSLQLESLEGRLLLSGASTVTWHGVQTQAIDGQYVAHLNTDVDFQKLAARKGFTNVATIADGYFQFDSPKSVGQMQRLASKLRAKVSISPNEISHLDFVPNDEFYGNQWHLHNTGALVTDPSGFSDPQNGAVGADIEAEKAWDITTGSRDVVVAVLDTGIDYNHPDLAANMFTNTKEIAGNGIDDDGNGFVDDTRGWNFDENTNDPIDLNGHGTNVAGIIGAVGNNGIGVSGVAQQVQLLPVRIFPADGGATDATIIAGIEYITMLKHEGFNIVAINASLGGQTFPFDEVESAAVADAGTAGIVFLAAAGNDSINNDAFQSFPAKYSLNLPNVITVAATDNQDKLAGFSNYGAASVDVAAPGVGIFATAPSYDTTITGELVGVEDFRQYAALSGTSQATPIVTGIVALEKAANPNATVAQLKQAVLDGAVQIPSLHSPYNIPNVVATGGRVDAYRSIRNIQNQFVTGDVFSEGNWQGSYGQQGAYVVGDSTAFPDFAPVVATGGVSKVINASTSNPVALQKVTDPNSRIEGYFSTADTMTFDMNFTDTATHRVTLYAADYERLGRSERVDILDASSGAILDTQFIPDFKQGEYLQWDLQGAVQIKVTNTSANPSPTVTDPNPARPDAVVSGLFFDTPTQSPFLFTGTDTTTRGAWMGTFGSEGLFLPGQSSAFPGFVGVNLTGGTGQLVKPTSKDPRGLQYLTNDKKRFVGDFSTPDVMTFDMNFTGAHQMTLYATDFEKAGRQERIDLIDPDTGAVLTSQTLSDFSNGKYLSWNVSGHVLVRVTKLAGPDAVVNGFFFDTPAGGPARFIGSDFKSRGNWKVKYGHDGGMVIGESNTNLPNFAQLSINGKYPDLVTEQATNPDYALGIIKESTRDKVALQTRKNSRNRIEAALAVLRDVTLDFNFTDQETHRVSFYVADYDKQGRSERFDVIDPTTGNTISTQDVTNFANGRYVTWDLRGHVQVRITRTAGPNAVLSGIFFD